jgi:hypothetical protein
MGLARPVAGVGPNPHSGVGLARPMPAVGLEPLPAVWPGLSFMGFFFFFFCFYEMVFLSTEYFSF